jgi:perosamine synthetase
MEYKEIARFIRQTFNQPEVFIPLHAPVFSGNEKKYLDECIDSTFVSSVGKFVDRFEEEVAKYTGAKKAVVCVNGTNALHLALMLAGVERDDEVITQPLTFIATANAISYCGAHPVFIDVDKDTLGLSPQSLESWLQENVEMRFPKPEAGNKKPEARNKLTNRRISACVPMHTFGHPCRIDEITSICEGYNIALVEDAAESLGSFYKGQHTGTFGKIGVISFNGNKIITTGGGGMLLFDDVELANKAKHLTTQAKVPHPYEFIHDEIGYNYRMPNINAALGVAQLEQLPAFLQAKRKLAEAYSAFFSALASVSKLTFFTEPENAKSNYWLNCILLNNREERDEFLKYTNENGVMTRPVWELMNRLPMFKDAQCGDLSNSEWIADRLVNIPSSVNFV